MREFIPAQILEIVQRERLRVLLAGAGDDPVPVAGAANPRDRSSSLRLIVYGAAPIPAELLKQAMAIFPCGFQQV